MKNHVWRPLFVVLGIVAAILLMRLFLVPSDFGVHDTGYMYGWYRQGNIAEWQGQKPKYLSSQLCSECHEDRSAALAASPHAMIPCENCHGPALDHPDNPEKLPIDRGRPLCLRCHTSLPYPSSGRSAIPGIDPEVHNPGQECTGCHDPHHPNLEEM